MATSASRLLTRLLSGSLVLLMVLATGACSQSPEGSGSMSGSLLDNYPGDFDRVRIRLYTSELSVEYVRNNGEVPLRVIVDADELVDGEEQYILPKQGDITGQSRGRTVPDLTEGTVRMEEFEATDGADVKGRFNAQFQAGTTLLTLEGRFEGPLEIVDDVFEPVPIPLDVGFVDGPDVEYLPLPDVEPQPIPDIGPLPDPEDTGDDLDTGEPPVDLDATLDVGEPTVDDVELDVGEPPGDDVGLDVGDPDVGDPDVGTGDPDVGDPDVGDPDTGTGDPDVGDPDTGTGDPDVGTGDPDTGTGDPDVGTGDPDVGDPDVGTGDPDVGDPDVGTGNSDAGTDV